MRSCPCAVLLAGEWRSSFRVWEFTRCCVLSFPDGPKSARGLAHSKTLARGPRAPKMAKLFECASPLALWHPSRRTLAFCKQTVKPVFMWIRSGPIFFICAVSLCSLSAFPAQDNTAYWQEPMKKVHARFTGAKGIFAQFGDSI